MQALNEHNPFRPPNWRWERARWLRSASKRLRRREDDEWVVVTKAYQAAKAKCKDEINLYELSYKYPGIYWAEQIFTNAESDVRWYIEAQLLANEELAKIADTNMTSVETVLWYERLFFNVLPYLEKDGYIINVVLGRSVHMGVTARSYDLLWKMIAWHMGPTALAAFVKPLAGIVKVNPGDRINAAWQDAVKASLYRKCFIAAETVPVGYNQINLLELYNQMTNIEKSATGGAAQNVIVENINTAFANLPFSARQESVARPQLKEYDESSAELRADELLAVAVGQESPAHREVKSLSFPTTEPKNDSSKNQ